MVTSKFVSLLLTASGLLNYGRAAVPCPLQVQYHLNNNEGADVVSSIIIGSQAAVVIDLPWTISKAVELAAWVKSVTNKPLVAAFSTHSHPDHYLSGGAFLDQFPGVKYYANAQSASIMKNEAPAKVLKISGIFGSSLVVQNTVLPEAYNSSFFTLPGDEAFPIQLFSPLTGDTVDETMFWIPSSRTMIAGDVVYGSDYHLWLADLLTPALTQSWIATVGLIKALQPAQIIPGHTAKNGTIDGLAALNHTLSYLQFWQSKIESKGANFFTPPQISSMLQAAFPGASNSGSLSLLNSSAEEFGIGGARQDHSVPLQTFTSAAALDPWLL